MSDGFFGEFDPSLSISFDYIASDVGIALATLDHKAIVTAWSYRVFPNFSCAELSSIRACNLYTVFVRTLDFILDYVRLIVIDLDTDFV